MNTYSEMKDSKIEWIGQIPKHWEIKRMKYWVNFIKGIEPGSKNYTFDESKLRFIRVKDINKKNNKKTYVDIDTTLKVNFYDILLCFDGSPGSFSKGFEGIYSSGLKKIELNSKKLDYQYVFYSLYCNFIQEIIKFYSRGTTIQHASSSINYLNLILPNKQEQDSIAYFLDKKTSKLDIVIKNKKKQVKLLKEYEKIVINQAVTKGLNPNAEMKDSGIEWIGQISKDLILKRIKNVSFVKARIGWQGLSSDEYKDEGYSLLVTGTDFYNNSIKWETCHYVDEERYTQDTYIQVQNNDVLITKDGSIGKIALVENFDKKATLNSGVFVVRPQRNLFLPKYLFWILKSVLFTNFIEFIKTGSTISHLYQKTFETFSFPLPNLEKQKKIIFYLDNTINLINKIINKTKEEIIKLEEYKKILINDCVTGKMKVIA